MVVTEGLCIMQEFIDLEVDNYRNNILRVGLQPTYSAACLCADMPVGSSFSILYIFYAAGQHH